MDDDGTDDDMMAVRCSDGVSGGSGFVVLSAVVGGVTDEGGGWRGGPLVDASSMASSASSPSLLSLSSLSSDEQRSITVNLEASITMMGSSGHVVVVSNNFVVVANAVVVVVFHEAVDMWVVGLSCHVPSLIIMVVGFEAHHAGVRYSSRAMYTVSYVCTAGCVAWKYRTRRYTVYRYRCAHTRIPHRENYKHIIDNNE